MSKQKLIKSEYRPADESSFSEGAFKATLKKLNPILDHIEECSKVRDFIIDELKSNVSKPISILSGINNSLNLFKLAFDFHPTTPRALSGLPQQDLFFQHVIRPILNEIIVCWNHHILAYFHLGAEELIVTDSPATSSHQLTCLVHKGVRILLSLLKRILEAGDEFQYLTIHFAHLQLSLEGLVNATKLELPLDVKCNLGLGICYMFKIMKKPVLDLDFVEIVFSPASFIGENAVNQLAFTFGLLTVSSLEDSDFEARMVRIGQFLFTVDHGSKEALNLGTARVLELWMEKLVQSQIPLQSSRNQSLLALFPDIEFFVFSYLPGHIDAVKSCCRNILRNLTKIYERMEPSNIWSEIKGLVERILVKPDHIKWMALWCVTSTTRKSLVILEIDPDLPQTLLSCERTMKNPASEVYLTLMCHHLAELSDKAWETKWIAPLFTTQTQLRSTDSNWAQKRSILSSILKLKEKRVVKLVLDFVLWMMNSTERGSSCTESTLLAVDVIKLATELKVEMNQVVSDDTTFFRGLTSREVLHSWATSSRMQIRLACFSLLIESKKSSEIISSPDLQSLKLVFKYNIVSQNPAFRQQFFAYYKKLIKRFRDSYNLLLRTRDVKNVECYNEFFGWLWNFLTKDEGLFPGANFGRRCQCLEFIAYLLEKFDVDTLKILLPSNDDVAFLLWIFDTYEYNKKLVFPILLKLYRRILEEGKLGDKLLEAMFHLCESVHPPDSVTGSYLGLFLTQHRHNDVVFIELPELLKIVLRKLTTMKNTIRETSLIEVATQTQMYGYLRLIRTLFTENLSSQRTTDIRSYRALAVEILQLCLEINEILLPILGDAAPEGFLPGLPDSEPGNSQVVRSINAQRLLVCSWRSMRDICMLLSEMVTLFPVEGESSDYVWSFDEVQQIGDHLLFLMHRVMHRGVFEQVFTGFKNLAYRLFKSTSGKLNDLPVKWLNEAFDEELISSKCYTRRSAGLPFIFQALLSPMCSNEPFVCKYLDRLLEQYSESEEGSTYIRIHCTNVLRGLFKDATFSRVMMPYVPKGLKLVFEQIKSPQWNESNAGLMLYGSIIRRTFGPELNLMTAPTFFRRFPEMYEFLLNKVKSCAETVIRQIELPNMYGAADDFTYQVLLLLSSFAITGVVEYGPFKISEFIEPIRTCASSPDYQVREIAAKALKPFLINAGSKIELILSILEEYKKRPLIKRANVIHGDLLQIFHVLKSIPEEESKEALTEAFNNIFTSDNLLWTFPCPTIFESLADICMVMGPKLKGLHANLQHFYAKNFDALRSTDFGRVLPGLANADSVVAKAQVQFLLYDPNPEMVIYNWVMCKPREMLVQVFTALSSRKFLYSSSGTELRAEVLAVFDVIVRRYLYENFEYPAQTTEEEAFLDFLTSGNESVYRYWTEISDNLKYCQKLFERVQEICEMEVGTVDCKAKAVVLLGKLAFQTEMKLSTSQIGVMCKIFNKFCEPSCDSDLRLAVAKCLALLPLEKLRSYSVLEQYKMWYTVLMLIMDDDGSVRNEIYSKLGEDNEPAESDDGGGRNLFCERKSCELIVHSFLTEFGQRNVLDALVLIVGLILRDDYEISVTGTEDNGDDHLFERSEMNAYAEPFLLAKIFLENVTSIPLLHESFRTHFHNSTLTPDLIKMYEFVANIHISLENYSSSLPPTLENLVAFLVPGSDGNSSEENLLVSFLDKSVVQRRILNLLFAFFS